MKIELEKTKRHKCGCVLRLDGNVWIKYHICEAHEPKHTKPTREFGRRREIFNLNE